MHLPEMVDGLVHGLDQQRLLLVVDVSNAQGQVDWRQVAAHGVHGALIKATEGHTFTDAYVHANRAGAAAAKIHAGLYHYARPDLNGPEAEADHFAQVVGTLHPFELRPALDMETAGHVDCAHAAEWARRFSQRLHRHLHVFPIFYSYGPFIDEMRRQATVDGKCQFAEPIGSGLWLAAYGRNDGQDHGVTVPQPWRHWLLHQFTSNGRLPGVRGHVDLSHCRRLPLVAG